MEQDNKASYSWIPVVTAAILLSWRALLWLDLPQPEVDPVWYLSQTFSMLRGDWLTSTFGHSVLVPYQMPYMYGIISLPFFGVFPWREYSVFAWSLLLAGLNALAVLALLRAGGVRPLVFRLVVLIAFLTSPYLYGPRPEVAIILLMLLALNWLSRLQREPRSLLGIAGLASVVGIAGLVQPVGGVFFVFLVAAYALQNRYSLRFLVIFAVSLVVFLAISYGPIILIDVNYWFLNFFSRFSEGEGRGRLDLFFILFYSVYSPGMYIPFVASLIGRRDWRTVVVELLLLLLPVFILLPFSRSYYYPYLMVYLLWRITILPTPHFSRWLAAGLVLIMPFFSHIWPTIQQLENRDYVATFRDSLDAVAQYADIAEHSILWVPAALGMPVIEYPGARMYFSYYRRFFGEGITLGADDVALAHTPRDLQNLLSLLGPDLTEADIEVREVIPPATGLLTPVQERGDSTGLWEIRRLPR